MNEKQQQLTFDKGITNVPSDAICDDNALEDSIGMVYDDGEHKVIQKPANAGVYIPSGATLIGTHIYGSNTRYIIRGATMIQWTTGANGFTPIDIVPHNNEPASVQAIGKTLVISTSDGLRYCLWSGNVYILTTNEIPQIKVSFSLGSMTEYHDQTLISLDMGDVVGGFLLSFGGLQGSGLYWKNGKYEQGKDAIVGLVSQRLNKIKEEKKFAFPFWIRFAIRLYDDSYTNISNPILIMPTVRNNWKVFACWSENGEPRQMDSAAGEWSVINYRPICFPLKYQVVVPQGVNIDDWEDIISGVDVFVSEEVKTFDMEAYWTIENFGVGASGSQYANPIFNNSDYPVQDYCAPEFHKILLPAVSQETMFTYYRPTPYSESEIKQKLIDCKNFYKLFSLDLEDLRNSNVRDAADKILSGVMPNLREQPRLEQDDYYSHTTVYPSVIKAYNSRLHMGDISRSFFDGFDSFSYSAYGSSSQSVQLEFFTFIQADTEERIIQKTVNTREIEKLWFYYPDTRAKKVEIYKQVSANSYVQLLSAALKEHPSLNGAYYFGDLPNGSDSQTGVSARLPIVNDDVEIIENQLVVSEVNNPYVFNASGYISVGTGKILGMASQTEAVGQEEHGLHPLIVFTSKGIWILKTNDEGEYVRADPSKRDVCNNPASITETDGSIFFSSEKGLMVMVGNSVECVSRQLSGNSATSFKDYLKTSFIAYDYRDSLLWIFGGSRYCWIYSMKSGTFGRYDFGQSSNVDQVVTAAVNNYPDYLLQIGTNVFSLLDRPDIMNDGTTVSGLFVPNIYSATLITRPMKLENALALKSIMQVRHIYQFTPYSASDPSQQHGHMTLRIFASNNLTNWVELHSLRGTPWKYYKFRYDFTGLKATDRFAGTMLITQERRTNKMR